MIWRNSYGRGRAWPRLAFWPEMDRWQRQFDFMLGGTSGPIRRSFPAINAWSGDEGLVVAAEIPGVDPDDINITVEGKTLTLSGERHEEELPEGAHYRMRERGSGEFSRTFELPYHIDADAVEANFRNGVLEIVLPRLPEEKPKKIAVSVAA